MQSSYSPPSKLPSREVFHKQRQMEEFRTHSTMLAIGEKRNFFDTLTMDKKEWKDCLEVLKKEPYERTDLELTMIVVLCKRLRIFRQGYIPDELIEKIARFFKYMNFPRRSIVRTNLPDSTLSHFYILLHGSVTATGRYRKDRDVKQDNHTDHLLSLYIGKTKSNRSTPSSNSRQTNSRNTYRGEEKEEYSEYSAGDVSCMNLEYTELGDCMGEHDLDYVLYEHESKIYEWRSSNEDTGLLRLDREMYEKYLKRIHEGEILDRCYFLKTSVTVPLFTGYVFSVLYEIAKQMTNIHYGSRKVIIEQGDASANNTSMYFIRSGECIVLKRFEFMEQVKLRSKPEKISRYLELARLRPGEYFGELVLIQQQQVERKEWQMLEEQAKKQAGLTQPETTSNRSAASNRGMRKSKEEDDLNFGVSDYAYSKKRHASIFTATPTNVLELTKSTFIQYFTNSSFLKMEEYAKGYAKETEIRQQYTKQRKWLIEKAQIVRSVINSSAIK